MRLVNFDNAVMSESWGLAWRYNVVRLTKYGLNKLKTEISSKFLFLKSNVVGGVFANPVLPTLKVASFNR